VILYDEEREKREREEKDSGVPPEDLTAAEPLFERRRSGQTRGPYGARLSKSDRKLMIQALEGGCTLGAMAQLLGRAKSTIEDWRSKGAAGVPGYAALYRDMERAMGRSIHRLHVKTNTEAVKKEADGRLALALLDRRDPEFIAFRTARRAEGSVEVVAAAGVQSEGAAGAKVAARITYSLSWEDGSPVRFPGLHGAPLALPAVEPGGNGGRPKAVGSAVMRQESIEEDDLDRDEIG
jgi:hypothetical protein